MELFILFVALLGSICLALVTAVRFAPNGLSEFELRRLAVAGDHLAVTEEKRREILPTLGVLRNIKQIILTILLLWLLCATHEVWAGILLGLMFLLLSYVVATLGWLAKPSLICQKKLEAFVSKHRKYFLATFGWLAAKRPLQEDMVGIASRDELRSIIANDTRLLAPQDKARLLGAFDFGSLLVADAMVPRDKIITVESSETVGPLMLDRLHKDEHNVYVVIKKNIDHIKGFLYMHDLTPLDPDIKEVEDAMRPTVHYLPANAPLQDVLSASLSTGRQLFIAVDDEGKTKGLITLADALKYLNGEPVPKVDVASTKSKR